MKIKVCAILNDTTATLMSCAWKHSNCKMGVILGTGTNACYIEKARNAELFDKPDDENIIINSEWGSFGDYGSLGFIRTSYDEAVDKMSINPGSQLFEKMTSGMYLGELTRLVLVRLATGGIMFNGNVTQQLNKPYQFFTKFMSQIEAQPRKSIEAAREVLKEIGYDNPSDQDCVNIRYVCECVSRRAAHLVSAAIAAIILRMGYEDITIGVDGSLYRFHPTFHDLMTEKIKELVPANYNFKFALSEDESGCGAALVAAVATRQQRT